MYYMYMYMYMYMYTYMYNVETIYLNTDWSPNSQQFVTDTLISHGLITCVVKRWAVIRYLDDPF